MFIPIESSALELNSNYDSTCKENEASTVYCLEFEIKKKNWNAKDKNFKSIFIGIHAETKISLLSWQFNNHSKEEYNCVTNKQGEVSDCTKANHSRFGIKTRK